MHKESGMSVNELFLAWTIYEIWGFLEFSAPELGENQKKPSQEEEDSRDQQISEIFRARKSGIPDTRLGTRIFEENFFNSVYTLYVRCKKTAHYSFLVGVFVFFSIGIVQTCSQICLFLNLIQHCFLDHSSDFAGVGKMPGLIPYVSSDFKTCFTFLYGCFSLYIFGLGRPFMIFGRRLDLNPESCRIASMQARYQLSHPPSTNGVL